MDTFLKNAQRVILISLILWFIISNVLIFMPSFQLWNTARSDNIQSIYKLITEDIMIKLIDKVLTGFLAFAGITATAKVSTKWLIARQGQQVDEFKWF